MRLIFLCLFMLMASCAHNTQSNNALAPAHFICSGTEPFWSLELQEGQAVMRRVTMAPAPERTEFSGDWDSINEDAGSFTWRGTGAEGREFDVTITRAMCQSTRDEPYSYKSSYGTGRPGGVFEPGCCERRS